MDEIQVSQEKNPCSDFISIRVYFIIPQDFSQPDIPGF
jgi:hypothetical protein